MTADLNAAQVLFVRGHPFVDGNERTGIAAAALMLVRNGWPLTADNDALEAFTLAVAQSTIGFDDIVRWLRRHSEAEPEARTDDLTPDRT